MNEGLYLVCTDEDFAKCAERFAAANLAAAQCAAALHRFGEAMGTVRLDKLFQVGRPGPQPGDEQ